MNKHYSQKLRTLFTCCLSKTVAIHVPLEPVPPEPILCDNLPSEEVSESEQVSSSEIETIILPKTEIIVPNTIDVEMCKPITYEYHSDIDSEN